MPIIEPANLLDLSLLDAIAIEVAVATHKLDRRAEISQPQRLAM